jgi:NADH dehydrogenase FAD-containing subunit
MGDCANIEGAQQPATAQVASQKGEWLARSLNQGEFNEEGFLWNDMGVMAYLGNWKAIFQNDVAGDISGRSAFLIWRGAYVTKAVSTKNKVSVLNPRNQKGTDLVDSDSHLLVAKLALRKRHLSILGKEV